MNTQKPRGPKGLGSTYQYNGKWWYAESFMVDGKRKKVRGSGNTPFEARKKQAENLRNYHLGLRKQNAPRHKISEVFEQWLNETPLSKLKEESRVKYRNNIQRHVIDVLGDKTIEELTPEMLIKHFEIDLVRRGVGDSAILHTKTNLRTLLNYAVDKDIITKNPSRNLDFAKRSKVEDDDTKYIQRNTSIFFRFLDWLEETDHEIYPHALLIGSGLRISELLGLEWDCFSALNHSQNARITIQQQLNRPIGKEPLEIIKRTKNKASRRRLPLSTRQRKALLKRKAEGRQAVDPRFANAVFLKPDGKMMTQQGFNKVWKTALKNYHIAKGTTNPELQHYFRPHYCRHIFASVMLGSGVDVKTVSDMLGHSSVDMSLSVYTHSSTENKKKAMELYGLTGDEITKKKK